MPGGREPVLSRGFRQPFVHFAALELGDAVTARADEMVMVTLAAEAITRLARPMGEFVDDAVLAQERKGPVHGREPDRLIALP